MKSFEEIRGEIRSAMARQDAHALRFLASDMAALGTSAATGMALQARAASRAFQGDIQEAKDHLVSALAVYEEAKDQRGIADVAGNLANVLVSTGDVELAMEYYHRALALHTTMGDRHEMAIVTGNIAGLMCHVGDYAHALEYYGRALSIHEDLGDRIDIARVTLNLGLLYHRVGDYPKALDYNGRAYTEYDELAHPSGVATALRGIADVYHVTGDHELALEHYEQALLRHEQLGEKAQVVNDHGNMGVLFARVGDFEKGLEHLRRALALSKQLGSRSEDELLTNNIVASLLEVGAYEEAGRLLDGQSLEVIDRPAVLAMFHANRARLSELSGELLAAKDHLEQALALVTQSGERAEAAKYHLQLREIAHTENDLAAYVSHNNEYQRISEEVRGQEATRKLAMLEAEKRIHAERADKEKHRALLYSTLPPAIADRVLRGEPVNDTFDNVAVVFMDLVGFTSLSSELSSQVVVNLLSEIFTTCDTIIAEHGLMKIKTIGDSYMAVSFSNTEDQTANTRHVVSAARAAVEVIRTLSATHPNIRVRIGMHSGPVTAGVIGTERLQYDIWGDTVNTASRMESHGEPGRIHVSESFATSLRSVDSGPWTVDENNDSMTSDSMTLEKRGVIDVKGKGQMKTYWLF